MTNFLQAITPGAGRACWKDLLLLVVITGVVYAPSLAAWFHGDDFVHLDLLSQSRPDALANIWSGQRLGLPGSLKTPFSDQLTGTVRPTGLQNSYRCGGRGWRFGSCWRWRG